MLNTYKNKFFVALIIFVIVFIIAWIGPIGQTIKTKRHKEMMENEIGKLENANSRISFVKNQLNLLNLSIGIGDSSLLKQRELFVKLSEFSMQNHTVIREIPERHVFNDEDIGIVTHTIRVEGKYQNLLKFIYDVEQKIKSYSIISLKFNRFKDKKTKQHRLIVEVLIQGIRKK